MMNESRTTIQRIAEEVGLSVTTVSRVLNGKGRAFRIGRETEQRVLEAAKRLDFTPNLLARGLRLQSSSTIGLVVPNVADPFFGRVARVIVELARKRGYSVLLCDSSNETDIEISEIQLLRDRAAEGLIICPVGISSEHIKRLEDAKLPVVLLDRYFPDLRVAAVSCDNVKGAADAVEHLIEHGHRRIGCLKGLDGTLTNEERVNGYRQALEKHSIQYDEELVLGDDFSWESGFESAQQLFEIADRATAIFAISNQIATGALKAISHHGYRVPDDISVVGFDDIEMVDLMANPISTVNQPVDKLAQKAADLLFSALIEKIDIDGERVLLPGEFVRRHSVRPLPTN